MRAELFSPPLPGLFVVVGAMGSGKSEFSVALALSFAARGYQAALADLDVVNPYFRSRSQREEMERMGVRVVAPAGALAESDLPIIPAESRALVENDSVSGVLDVGGGPGGARVLGTLTREIARRAPPVYYVFNRSRPDNATPGRAAASITGIEAAGGLRITGIVHNTHLIGFTTPDTVLEGAEAAGELSRLTGLPVVCHAAREDLIPGLTGLTPLFPLRPRLLRPWEDDMTGEDYR